MKINPVNEPTNTANMGKTAQTNSLSPSYDEINITGSKDKLKGEVSKQQILERMKTLSAISPNVSPEIRKLINAAERAPVFLVNGNMPEGFKLQGKSEVDPGSFSSYGVDSKGNNIWVVDQKVNFINSSEDLVENFFEAYFCGGAAGGQMDGPKMKLIAVESDGQWKEAHKDSSNDKGIKENPLQDSAVNRFILKVGGVHPVPGPGKLLPPAEFYTVVNRNDVKTDKNSSEFTLHFLNPDNNKGPFPGTADGAVRYRAAGKPDGSVDIEGYYLTRAAEEYVDNISDYMPGMQTGKKLFNAARNAYRMTPMGWFTGGIADKFVETAEKITDRAIGATDVMRKAVSTLHSQFYRKTLFPNIVDSCQ